MTEGPETPDVRGDRSFSRSACPRTRLAPLIPGQSKQLNGMLEDAPVDILPDYHIFHTQANKESILPLRSVATGPTGTIAALTLTVG